jgi:oligopeptide/dipeptide ABC transporter ATP-binding protein
LSLLELQGVAKTFTTAEWRAPKSVRAVDGIDLVIALGEAVGLVGESGCGKSTVARLVLRLAKPSRGRILFEGHDVGALKRSEMRNYRRAVQLVQQNPHAALDPRRTVFASISEPLVVLERLRGSELRERVTALMRDVALPESFLWRYPHELSGGQKQRVAIARALAAHPKLVVLDEPTSALDVSVQAQILKMLADLRLERGLAYLFISHNLAVVRHICDRVAVMYLGRIVEEGPVEAVFGAPKHPYTQALVASVLPPRASTVPKQVLMGDPPSASDLPKGCRFAPRCPRAVDACRTAEPALTSREAGRVVACLVE